MRWRMAPWAGTTAVTSVTRRTGKEVEHRIEQHDEVENEDGRHACGGRKRGEDKRARTADSYRALVRICARYGATRSYPGSVRRRLPNSPGDPQLLEPWPESSR